MTANTGFQARRSEPADSLDDFPTPPWATRAALEALRGAFGIDLAGARVREPCANRGFMARPLHEAGAHVIASDIHDYGVGLPVKDYLTGDEPPVDWVFMNPPFNRAVAFILRALDHARHGVAVFQRLAFKAGVESRYRTLFRPYPHAAELVFAERVPLFRGVLRDPDRPYFDPVAGRWKKPSTMADYAWFIWRKTRAGGHPATIFIPPCRRRLTRPGDYDSHRLEGLI